MRNFCIFCGKVINGGHCNCKAYCDYYNVRYCTGCGRALINGESCTCGRSGRASGGGYSGGGFSGGGYSGGRSSGSGFSAPDDL